MWSDVNVRRYLGEWYMMEGKGGKEAMPYPEQRDKAVHGAWLICIVYAALAVLCGFVFSYHSFRSPGVYPDKRRHTWQILY